MKTISKRAPYKLLKNFLRKHGVLNRYRRNSRKEVCMGVPFTKAAGDRYYLEVSSCFIWEESSEGHEYWNRLDELFNKELKQYTI